MKKPTTPGEYFATLPPKAKSRLTEMRKLIREAVPKDAEEVISYSMPAFSYKGIVVWYAAAKNHIGLYPKTNAIRVFGEELKNFKTSKGAIQFPMEKPIPKTLVKKIVKFRVQENLEAE